MTASEVRPHTPASAGAPARIHPVEGQDLQTNAYTLVTDRAGLERAAETLRAEEYIGLDAETTGLSPRDGRIRLLQLASPRETFVVDLFEVGELAPLKELLESGPAKILQNSKFDYAFLYAEYGLRLEPIFDTMLAAQLLGGGDQSPSYTLEALSERYLGRQISKTEQSDRKSVV